MSGCGIREATWITLQRFHHNVNSDLTDPLTYEERSKCETMTFIVQQNTRGPNETVMCNNTDNVQQSSHNARRPSFFNVLIFVIRCWWQFGATWQWPLTWNNHAITRDCRKFQCVGDVICLRLSRPGGHKWGRNARLLQIYWCWQPDAFKVVRASTAEGGP